MIAYKLCRLLKNGDITSLFINKSFRIPLGKWIDAENHPTKGFTERPYWHCTGQPEAKHLSNKNRVWVKVEIDGVRELLKSRQYGGKWFLAEKIKFIEILENGKSL